MANCCEVSKMRNGCPSVGLDFLLGFVKYILIRVKVGPWSQVAASSSSSACKGLDLV